MVQIGSTLEMCSDCRELKVCGEFWQVEPRFRVFWCADCLEAMLAGVKAAATRYALPLVQRA